MSLCPHLLRAVSFTDCGLNVIHSLLTKALHKHRCGRSHIKRTHVTSDTRGPRAQTRDHKQMFSHLEVNNSEETHHDTDRVG